MADTTSPAPGPLGTQPIGRLMLRLAVPTIAAQFIDVLYNVVDRIYIGNIPGIGAAALTGVGVTAPILSVIAAFAALAGLGGSPLAAIALGRGDHEGAQRILNNSFSLLLGLSAVLTVVFQLFKAPLLYWFGASDALIGYSLDYITIYLYGTVFVQLALGLTPFITAQGDTLVSLGGVLLGAGLNLVLDPLFIFVFGLGVRGAAIATVLSQGCSAAWVLLYLGRSRRSRLRLDARAMRPSWRVLGPVLALGVSPFAMSATESAVTVVLTSGMQRYGNDLYVGTITILQSCMLLIGMPVRGLVAGTEPIISFNYGAGQYGRCREALRKLMLYSGMISVCMAAVFTFWARPIARAFTADEALVELTARAMPIFVGGVWVFWLQIVCQHVFMALGQAKISLFLALLRKVILLVPLALLLPWLTRSVVSIYWAEPIADIAASLTTTAFFFSRYNALLPPQKGDAPCQP